MDLRPDTVAGAHELVALSPPPQSKCCSHPLALGRYRPPPPTCRGPPSPLCGVTEPPTPFCFFSTKPSVEPPLQATSHHHRLAFPMQQSSHKRLAPHPTSPPLTSCPSRTSDHHFPRQISNSHRRHCRLQGELHRSIGLTPEWPAYLMPLYPLEL
jgi:hypothetical protein